MLEIFDETKCGIDSALLTKVYEAVRDEFALPENVSVELTVVGEEEIRETNLAARGIDSVTDVLSFPSLQVVLPFKAEDYPDDVDLSTGEIMLGEIMLCYPRAIEQSKEYGHSEARECCYLVLHGLLHLLGYDHIEENDRVEMREKEEKILSSLSLSRD